MRIVREQMLCIITPAGPATEHALAACQPALDQALRSSGVVHFAAFAWLPPRAALGPGAVPSLLFELAVDEGLRPADTMTALVQAGFEPLWQLYGGAWPGDAHDTRAAWLRGYLLGLTSVADGGFIGARDRGVALIHDEHALLGASLAAARAVGATERAQPADFARAIADQVLSQPRFDWARQLWPASFWRGKAGTAAGKLRWLVTLGIAAALAVAIVGWVSGRLARYGPGFVGPLFATVHDLCTGVLAALPRLGQGLLFVVAVLLAFRVAQFVLPPLRRVVPNINQELDRADARPVATLYEAAVTLLALGLTLVAVGALVVLVASAFPGALGTLFSPAAAWVEGVFAAARAHGVPIAWAALAAACALGLVAARGRVLPPTLAARAASGYQAIGLWRPHEVPRAQRIEPSIEACEAELARAGRVAHMISLVDIRWPVPLFRFSLRLWLRLITAAGRIVYTDGLLGTAPGIHFGHWHIVDDGRRLLFCSNFDGKWGGYLDDFINGASRGLNAIWHCTKLLPRAAARPGDPAVIHERAFPPTRLGLWRGVKCEQWFKAYARDSMVPHRHRFESYRLSLQHIERATALRQALAGERNVVNDDKVMRVIES